MVSGSGCLCELLLSGRHLPPASCHSLAGWPQVYDSSKLAGHYMQSRAFLLDLGALLPLDLLQFNVGINPILRFPRFLKAYRVYHYYYMVESRTVYPNLWRVVNLIHILLVLAHWFGCFYFLLSQHEKFQVGRPARPAPVCAGLPIL